MRVLLIDDKIELKYFTSPKEMPAGRFKDFQKYLFEDWGVGTTMKDLDTRLVNAFNFVINDAKDKALQELHNLRLTANYIIQKLSIKSYALAILVCEFNGKKVEAYGESDLKLIVDEMEKHIPQELVEQVVDDVKKNLKLL